MLNIGIRRECLKEIKSAVAVGRHVVPETVVPTRPDEPHIAAFDFVWGQYHTFIHVAEVVLVRSGKTLSHTVHLLRLIYHCPWLRCSWLPSTARQHKSDTAYGEHHE